MGFDITPLFDRLGRIDLSRPRTIAAAGFGALALAAVAFLAGSINGASHAQRVTAADLNGWSAEME